jgi:hypothetical protein
MCSAINLGFFGCTLELWRIMNRWIIAQPGSPTVLSRAIFANARKNRVSTEGQTHLVDIQRQTFNNKAKRMVDLAKACADLSKIIGLFNDIKKDYVF